MRHTVLGTYSIPVRHLLHRNLPANVSEVLYFTSHRHSTSLVGTESWQMHAVQLCHRILVTLTS